MKPSNPNQPKDDISFITLDPALRNEATQEEQPDERFHDTAPPGHHDDVSVITMDQELHRAAGGGGMMYEAIPEESPRTAYESVSEGSSQPGDRTRPPAPDWADISQDPEQPVHRTEEQPRFVGTPEGRDLPSVSTASQQPSMYSSGSGVQEVQPGYDVAHMPGYAQPPAETSSASQPSMYSQPGDYQPGYASQPPPRESSSASQPSMYSQPMPTQDHQPGYASQPPAEMSSASQPSMYSQPPSRETSSASQPSTYSQPMRTQDHEPGYASQPPPRETPSASQPSMYSQPPPRETSSASQPSMYSQPLRTQDHQPGCANGSQAPSYATPNSYSQPSQIPYQPPQGGRVPTRMHQDDISFITLDPEIKTKEDTRTFGHVPEPIPEEPDLPPVQDTASPPQSMKESSDDTPIRTGAFTEQPHPQPAFTGTSSDQVTFQPIDEPPPPPHQPASDVDDMGWTHTEDPYKDTFTASSTRHRSTRTLLTDLTQGGDRDPDRNAPLSLIVRAPDIDDELFEHEDIFDHSPYLDPNKSSKNKKFSNAIHKMYGILAVSSRQQKIERAAFCAIIVVLIVVTIIMSLPSQYAVVPTATQTKAPPVPPEVDWRIANWYDPEDQIEDVPFFWQIPMSGGTMYADVLGSCLHLVQASEVGGLGGHVNDTELMTVEIFGESFVNVDVTTSKGITKAINLNLAKSGLADVVFSPRFNETIHLFNKDNQGRMFTLFRDPIQRSANMYHYFSMAKWDPMYNPQLKDISLEEYAVSNYMENNYMTRILLNKPGGRLSQRDVDIAKEIIRHKCLVGLFEEMEESMERFERYFGWSRSKEDEPKVCKDRVLSQGTRKYGASSDVPQGSHAWNLLYQQNIFDMELYNFAKSVFQYQTMDY